MTPRRPADDYRIHLVQVGTPDEIAAAEKRFIQVLADLLIQAVAERAANPIVRLEPQVRVHLGYEDLRAVLEGLRLLCERSAQRIEDLRKNAGKSRQKIKRIAPYIRVEEVVHRDASGLRVVILATAAYAERLRTDAAKPRFDNLPLMLGPREVDLICEGLKTRSVLLAHDCEDARKILGDENATPWRAMYERNEAYLRAFEEKRKDLYQSVL